MLSGEQGNFTTTSMQYGKQNKATAVKEWEDMSGIRTEKCGIFLSRDGITGATPDRLIGDDGLLEVKTLPKLVRKGITLEDYLKQSGHLKEYPLNRDEYGNVTLKTSHIHYHQVQGQLSLTGRKYCTLLYWIPSQFMSFDVSHDKEWD